MTIVLTLTILTPLLTADAALTTVAETVNFELGSDTAALTGSTNEQLSTLRVVVSHSEFLGEIRMLYPTSKFV